MDPEKCKIYKQSDLPAHPMLAWVLSCITNMGFMKRMHAYKASVDQGKADDISVGTFTYPILMAADIILYDANYVPVGKDQKQHVEYARDIAQKFNHHFGDTFVLPEPLIDSNVASIPGIDGRKMSKSYNNFIGLFEDEASVRKKIKRISTAPTPVEEPKNPDECNVYNMMKLFIDSDRDTELRARYEAGGLSYKDVKEELMEVVLDFLAPIQKKLETISDQEVIETLQK